MVENSQPIECNGRSELHKDACESDRAKLARIDSKRNQRQTQLERLRGSPPASKSPPRKTAHNTARIPTREAATVFPQDRGGFLLVFSGQRSALDLTGVPQTIGVCGFTR